jgi:NAD+ synthase (glutamine-hydrolysing)
MACEICEEIWVPKNLHVDYGLDGVEIISNASGSHHELRKLNDRLELVKNASKRNGGVYLYSNLKGCDGGRVLYDGGAMVCLNGRITHQLHQFSLPEVEVCLGAVDLDIVRRYRTAMNSRAMQSAKQIKFPRVVADIDICRLPLLEC